MTVAAGTEVPLEEIQVVTREILEAYAEASGDHNPIHLDDEVARGAGLPGVIAHGMLIAGYVAERAERFVRVRIPGEGWRIGRFQVRFKAMTFPGDAVSVGGSVKQATADEIVLDLRAQKQTGEVTTTATVVVKRD